MTIEISVEEGFIGVKTDPSNLFTYTITSDEGMTKVTESVNGVQVGYKTVISGVPQTVSMTQAQWDAVKYGEFTSRTGPAVGSWILSKFASGTFSTELLNPYTEISSGYHLRTPIAQNVISGSTLEISFGTAYSAQLAEFDAFDNLLRVSPDGATRVTLTQSTKSVRFIVRRLDNGIITASISTMSGLKLLTTRMVYPSNSIIVEMGDYLWTYSFNKQLAEGSDLLSVAKSVKDMGEVTIPSIKGRIIDVLAPLTTIASPTWKGIEDAITTLTKAEYGTAIAKDVLSGKTLGTASGLVTGTMTNRGSVKVVLTQHLLQVGIPEGYHDGTGYMRSELPNMTPSNIKSGVDIGGIIGNLQPRVYNTGTISVPTYGSFTVNTGIVFKSFIIYNTGSSGYFMFNDKEHGRNEGNNMSMQGSSATTIDVYLSLTSGVGTFRWVAYG